MNQLLLALFVATPLVICILDEKPYDHEAKMEVPSAPLSALDLCIIGIQKKVELGNRDERLHRKLWVKMMFRNRRDGIYGTKSRDFRWDEPRKYHQKSHVITQRTWEWIDYKRLFMSTDHETRLTEYQFYENGRVIERDPYDNSLDYDLD